MDAIIATTAANGDNAANAANENVDEMSPYDPFVNSNWKVGARAGTSRWTSDLVLMFLESAEPGEWE